MARIPLNLASDNVTGPAPEIVEAIVAAASGPAMPYGNDPWTDRVRGRLSAMFEREVAAFPVATGSAANALALASVVPSWGVVYCHRHAHIEEDECAAPEFFTGGAKLALLDGADGRIRADDLAARLADAGAGVVHHAQPAALSLTNATEAGTVYAPGAVAELADVAHRHGLTVHLDGARLANAIARTGCTPAEATWKAGIDVLSLGATKNGAFAAEVVVFFDPQRAGEFEFRRKRAGHLFSKMRLISSQLDAWLAEDRWLNWARAANAAADRLAEGLRAIQGVRILRPVEANILFAELPGPVHRALEAAGHRYYVLARMADGGAGVRLVCAWDTTPEAVDSFLADAGAAVASSGAR